MLRRYFRRDVLILLVFALVAITAAIVAAQGGAAQSWRDSLRNSGLTLKTTLSSEFFLNPWFYGVFVAILILERLIPAASQQPLLSTGARQDLWWVPFKLAIHATLLPLYVTVLGFLFERYLSGTRIEAVSSWPWLAKVFLGLLAGDFLFWISHFVRHKVTALWHFHAVHHSQRELNFFTEYRVHPLDDVFSWTVGFIPLFMVSQSFATITAVVWIRHWHTRFYHSNIRTNLGWLRYILVTPQSHRVHHSMALEHRDKNFGLTFSIWDYLFGTQYRKYDEYPATGIEDLEFPAEQEGMRWAGLGNLLEQLLYPFKAAARGSAGEPAALPAPAVAEAQPARN